MSGSGAEDSRREWLSNRWVRSDASTPRDRPILEPSVCLRRWVAALWSRCIGSFCSSTRLHCTRTRTPRFRNSRDRPPWKPFRATKPVNMFALWSSCLRPNNNHRSSD